MKLMILITLAAAAFLVPTEAKPADVRDAGVEIQKQRLIKFPDELENLSNESNGMDKQEEAKRILEEIAKINEALGYVKKQPDAKKLPPILDSSQYLFPKPPYHPFHSQKHQFSGSNGETLLVPSIRSVNWEGSRAQALVGAEKTLEIYNKPVTKVKTQPPNQSQLNQQIQSHSAPMQYYFRPNVVNAPHSPQNSQALSPHFAIPVRLYKLNKEQYLRERAPQEYRVKGYKIVGDVDNFYGKIKNLDKKKSSDKYQLFFLPRELTLKEPASVNSSTTMAAVKNSTNTTTKKPQEDADTNSSREEKLAIPRPFKIQASASTTSNNNGGITNSSASTQIIRKRIVPKPLREKETSVEAVALQQKPVNQLAATAPTIRITPPPLPMQPNINANQQSQAQASQQTSSSIAYNSNNATASNAIKTAFQNIFKFPFRQQQQQQQQLQPLATESPVTLLQSVPLQQPTKTIFAAQPMLPSPFYYNQPQQQQQQQHNNDYKWEDDMSNSPEVEEYDSAEPPQEQKHIFAHAHKNQQQTQIEALKQGGIIIQRLKVRKGGIAIAGPGGVATAGSGGTAIVGPGGYALTHPRSLTIAGPGAKVIAIPANVDLKDALERTNLSTLSFPREGKIVATGPTVYYSPTTGTGMGTGMSADF